ncbi:MAG: HEAT repeat domain-containing protein [Planctomycetota bacterium]|nr:HEAT repeat domain-containing protein [Planctomycetota bacterium]
MKTNAMWTVLAAGLLALAAQTARAAGEEKPQPKCPVSEPKEIPEQLKLCFDKSGKATLDEKKAEMREVAKADRADALVDPLRWLMYQNAVEPDVRYGAASVLVDWNIFGIGNELKTMMLDPLQDAAWRAKCVQLEAMLFSNVVDKNALAALEGAMASEDAVVRDEAAFAGAWLARMFSWDHTARERYDRVVALVEKQLGEPRPEAVTKALQAVAMLALKDKAPRVEKIVADEKQPEAVRLEAAKTLAAIARPESLPVLDEALKTAKGEVAAALNTARAFALAAQLTSAEAAAAAKAFEELSKMGLTAFPALEPLLMPESAETPREYARTILGDAVLKHQVLEPIDRKGLKKFGEEEGKPNSGNKNVLLDAEKKVIVMEGENLLERGALEYAVVCKGENAKTHESILGLECAPLDVVYALLACNYTFAGELKENGKINLPKGAGAMLSMEFERETWTPKGKDKKRIRIPLNLMIWNAKGGHVMKKVPWAFTGSRMQKMPDGNQVLMAQIEKSIVAIMSDPNAIMNTPVDGAESANVNPQQGAFYVVNPMLAPKRGAKCSLVIEPWTGDKLTAEDVHDDGVTAAPPEGKDKKE